MSTDQWWNDNQIKKKKNLQCHFIHHEPVHNLLLSTFSTVTHCSHWTRSDTQPVPVHNLQAVCTQHGYLLHHWASTDIQSVYIQHSYTLQSLG